MQCAIGNSLFVPIALATPSVWPEWLTHKGAPTQLLRRLIVLIPSAPRRIDVRTAALNQRRHRWKSRFPPVPRCAGRATISCAFADSFRTWGPGGNSPREAGAPG